MWCDSFYSRYPSIGYGGIRGEDGHFYFEEPKQAFILEVKLDMSLIKDQ